MPASRTPEHQSGCAKASPIQESWWFLSQLLPATPVGTAHRRFHVSGTVNFGALRAAWRTLLRRHMMLRARFDERDGRPVRVVAPEPADESFVIFDLRGLPADEASGKAERLLAREIAAVADLARGPLARLTVVRRAATTCDVLLTTHAAVADEPSTDRLVAELSEAYERAWRTTVSRDPDPPAGARADAGGHLTSDGGEWVSESLSSALTARTERLTPVPAPLALPLDRPRATRARWHARTLRFDWGSEVARMLQARCRAEHTTELSNLAAAFLVLLGRHGDAKRLALTVPATVPPDDVRVGPMTNLLVIPGDLHPATAFGDMVHRTSGEIEDALRHREVPFHHLVRTLPVDRDPRRIPLSDAMIVLREGQAASLSLVGATVTSESVDPQAILADFVLTIESATPRLAGALAYRADLFDRQTVAGMLGQFRTLLTAALDAPATRLGDLPLMSDARRCAVLAGADRIDKAVPPDEPVHAVVRRHGRRHADLPAVVAGPDTLTYRQLDEEAAGISARLAATGAAGTAVAVRIPPGPRQIAASLGALHAGAHLVWIGVDAPSERCRSTLAMSRSRCMLVDGPGGDDEITRWFRDELGGTVVHAGQPPSTSMTHTTAPTELDRTAYVAFTSGSTGRPKGIAQSHAALAQFVTWFADEFGIGPGSRVAQWVAPEHDPSICEVFATLTAGGSVHTVPPRLRTHPEKLAEWLVAERITFLQTVPSFARELLKALTGRAGTPGLANLRWLVLMGESVPTELLDGLRAALPTTRIANVYGPTETIAATWHEANVNTGATVPIGVPIPGRQVLVLDDDDRPCPPGVTGQIVIRSPYVTAGYLSSGDAGDPDESAFRPVTSLELDGGTTSRWYRTGDLGRLRWDGLLEFRGRRDLQVKLNGNRVELTEFEAALSAHESVAECAVIAVTGPDGLVNQLVAFVVPSGSATSGAALPTQWRSHLRRRFGPSLALVSIVTMRGRLPRNAAGKVDRRRLPLPERLLVPSARGPRGPVEESLARIWSELLHLDVITAQGTFFTCGGHSLLIPVLADRITRRFGVRVPIADMYVNPTLSGMADLIIAARSATQAAWPPSVPPRRSDHPPPLPGSKT